MFNRIKLFLEESKQEFKRVNWPSFQETARLTMIVVVFSLLTAVFLGVLDTIFAYFLSKIV